jgi:hypothetical protein
MWPSACDHEQRHGWPAIIYESVTTGAGRNVASSSLVAANSETTMPILDGERQPIPFGIGRLRNEMTINPMQSAHDAPPCKASKRTGKPCRAPKEAISASRYVNALAVSSAKMIETRKGLVR